MRIPDGDLVPARRHRYGGGYGRRRSRRLGPWALALAVVLAATAGGLWLARRGGPATATAPCPTPTPAPVSTPELPRPQEVRLRVLNGTPRNGLALQVASVLRARGFVVVAQGNAPAALGGASQVLYGAGALPAARLVSFQVVGAAVRGAATGAAGAVTLVLGGDFRRLATPAEVSAAVRAAAAPAASARPSGARPSPSCGS